jgi:hypothetical protein
MGYSVYNREGRWAGYGVPAICDHPGCGRRIDRGFAYLCGEDPWGEKGCGLFFCSDHLFLGPDDDDPFMCERCVTGEPSFNPTPDIDEWISHMLADESWQQWRDENQDKVAQMIAAGRAS